MPAHADRKQIIARMYPEQRVELDVLCEAASEEKGEKVGRTEVINGLVHKAYLALSTTVKKRLRQRLNGK